MSLNSIYYDYKLQKIGSDYHVLRNDGVVTHSGINAATVINGAITELAGTGRSLAIPGNTTVNVDSTITIAASTLTLKGIGGRYGLSRMHATGNFPVITIDASAAQRNRITIEDLYLTHNSATYDNIGLIELNTGTGGAKAISSVNIQGCYFYDSETKKGNAIRLTNDDSPLYKINVINCEAVGFKESVYVDVLQNNALNSWVNNNSFINFDAWLPSDACFKVASAGSNGAFDGNVFTNYRMQPTIPGTSIGFDFETAHLGHSWYMQWTDCFVWDLTGTRDAWKFNGSCEGYMKGCFPDFKIGGAGATNGKITKDSHYSRKSGLASFNGTGSQTAFTVTTGLGALAGGTITPTIKSIHIDPRTEHAMGFYWLVPGADTSSFTVNYAVAPPSGSSNVQFFWEVRT